MILFRVTGVVHQITFSFSYFLFTYVLFIHFIHDIINGVLYPVFNKSKFYSGRNEEQIEARKCLLSFGAEPFVFQVAIQKFKDQDI